jgi:predicted nucleotidyltransferase
MADESVIEVVRDFSRKVLAEFAPRYIVLFGSHAYGVPHEYSDIDVGVVFSGLTERRFPIASRLCLLAMDVDTRVEPVVLDTNNDKIGFAREVLRKGIILYDSSNP